MWSRVPVITLACLGIVNAAHGLSLHEAMEQVMAHNPQVLSAQKGVKVAEEDLKQAFGAFLPEVDFNASMQNQRREINGGTETNSHPKSYELALNQTLFAGGSLVYDHRRVRNLLAVNRAARDEAVQSVLLDLVEAYMDVLQNREVISLHENQVKVLSEQKAAADARFKQGEVTKTDVKQAEARLAQAEADLIRAEGDLIDAEAALTKVLGNVPAEIKWPQAKVALPESKNTAQDMALANHPSVVAALSNVAAGKYAVKIARADHFPTLTATAGITTNENASFGSTQQDSQTRSIGLELSLPLFRGGRTLSGVRQAVEEQGQAEQDYEDTRRNVVQEATSAIHAYKVATASLEALQKSLEAARVAAKGTAEEAKLGERTVLDVLDTRQDLLEAEVDVTRARRDAIVSAYRVLAATGQLTQPVKP